MTAPIPLRPAVAAGDWIAISGQLGLKDGALVEGGAQAQAAQALANLRDVVESHGARLEDVVKNAKALAAEEDERVGKLLKARGLKEVKALMAGHQYVAPKK